MPELIIYLLLAVYSLLCAADIFVKVEGEESPEKSFVQFCLFVLFGLSLVAILLRLYMLIKQKVTNG